MATHAFTVHAKILVTIRRVEKESVYLLRRYKIETIRNLRRMTGDVWAYDRPWVLIILDKVLLTKISFKRPMILLIPLVR